MALKPVEQKSALERLVPIVDWLPRYKWGKWLRFDVIAALTVWALLVPEAMAYAGIAGVPPEVGLVTAPLALVGYAIFGSSKQLFVGPSSTVAIISAAIVATLAGGDGDRCSSSDLVWPAWGGSLTSWHRRFSAGSWSVWR